MNIRSLPLLTLLFPSPMSPGANPACRQCNRKRRRSWIARRQSIRLNSAGKQLKKQRFGHVRSYRRDWDRERVTLMTTESTTCHKQAGTHAHTRTHARTHAHTHMHTLCFVQCAVLRRNNCMSRRIRCAGSNLPCSCPKLFASESARQTESQSGQCTR